MNFHRQDAKNAKLFLFNLFALFASWRFNYPLIITKISTLLMEIGRVKEIWRYPVKSMAGEKLAKAHIYWHGIDGDRRAAFVRGDNHSGFPWLTAREAPELVRYQPFYTNAAEVIQSPIEVRTPDGSTLSLDSNILQQQLAHAYGHDVSLIRIKRGIYDSLTLSVMSTATARALNAAVDFELDHRRFRQNLVIELFAERPFAEESWIGNVLAIGDIHIRLNQKIPRCVMVNVDPDTAVRNPQVLKLAAQTRANCVGVGCTPETTGMIQVGDVIKLIESKREAAHERF